MDEDSRVPSSYLDALDPNKPGKIVRTTLARNEAGLRDVLARLRVTHTRWAELARASRMIIDDARTMERDETLARLLEGFPAALEDHSLAAARPA